MGFKYGLKQSEAKSAEEEPDVVSFVVGLGAGEVPVGLGESLPDFLAGGEPGLGGLDVLLLEVLEVEVVDDEPGGDDVILVDILDEGLHSGSLDELLLVDSSLDAPGVAGDADHQQVRESIFLQ